MTIVIKMTLLKSIPSTTYSQTVACETSRAISHCVTSRPSQKCGLTPIQEGDMVPPLHYTGSQR